MRNYNLRITYNNVDVDTLAMEHVSIHILAKSVMGMLWKVAMNAEYAALLRRPDVWTVTIIDEGDDNE